jgi:arylsulfatase A-like enzyme
MSVPRLAAMLAASLLACGGEAEAPRPDVVLIVVDTLRADHLTHYGYQLDTARSLDAFAAQATRFTRCFAPAPWTGPSTASILTGLHPARHGTVAHGSRISDEATPLAERLRSAGWRTAGFSHNVNVSHHTGFDRGFEHWSGYESIHFPHAEEMTAEVRAWSAELTGEPFFLYLQPMSCHGPYRVPAAAERALLGRPPDDFFRFGKGLNRRVRDGNVAERENVSQAYVTSLREQYDTAIRYTLDQVGAILDVLRERGRYDGALIVLTADHGEELFDHGGFGHAYSLHQENLHVPLYVKLPGQRDARVVDELVQLEDVYPTVMDLLRLSTTDTDGVSLRPLLEGPPDAPPLDRGGRPHVATVAWDERCTARSILDWPYKLIDVESSYEGAAGRLLLYDLASDPHERVDLAEREPEVVRRLSEELERALADLQRRALAPPGNAQDIERHLDALGY